MFFGLAYTFYENTRNVIRIVLQRQIGNGDWRSSFGKMKTEYPSFTLLKIKLCCAHGVNLLKNEKTAKSSIRAKRLQAGCNNAEMQWP